LFEVLFNILLNSCKEDDYWVSARLQFDVKGPSCIISFYFSLYSIS
jgi:hypothetical protein